MISPSSSVPHRGQPAQTPEREAGPPGGRVLFRKREGRNALDQGREDQLGLEAGKLRAEAMMDAAAERQRPYVGATDIQSIRVGVLRGIMVRRAEQDDDAFLGRERNA